MPFRSVIYLLTMTVISFFLTSTVIAEGRKIIDSKGRTVIVSDTSRILSVGGSVTEIIYALGEQDRIIARDSTSTYPSAALSKPNVGYMRALSSEGVLSVKPSIILALEGSGPPEVIQVLEKASVPLVNVPHKFTEEGVIEKIRFVGNVLNVPHKTDKLVKKVKAEFVQLRKLTEKIHTPTSMMFILSLRGGRVMAAGAKTSASGIIRMAGARNALAGIEGYKPIADEAIIRSAPEAILMMDRGGHSVKTDDLFKNPTFLLTPAAKNKKLIRLNGLYLLGFGPRTASAAKDLAIQLYGAGKITAPSNGSK